MITVPTLLNCCIYLIYHFYENRRISRTKTIGGFTSGHDGKTAVEFFIRQFIRLVRLFRF